jgi:hypothetical protein
MISNIVLQHISLALDQCLIFILRLEKKSHIVVNNMKTLVAVSLFIISFLLFMKICNHLFQGIDSENPPAIDKMESFNGFYYKYRMSGFSGAARGSRNDYVYVSNIEKIMPNDSLGLKNLEEFTMHYLLKYDTLKNFPIVKINFQDEYHTRDFIYSEPFGININISVNVSRNQNDNCQIVRIFITKYYYGSKQTKVLYRTPFGFLDRMVLEK